MGTLQADLIVRPTIAYVAAHLPSYYAQEQRVFARSLEGLEQLASTLEFDLFVAGDPVTGRGEAELAAACAEAEADFVLLQHGSFAMGDTVLPFADRDLRLGLWATAEPTKEGPILLNNFVSMNLAAGILGRYLGPRPFKWFYGDVEDPWFGPRLAPTVRALRGLIRLSQARIGLVSGLAPTFFNLTCDERALRERLGTEVSAHELGELYAGAQAAAPAEVDSVVAELHEAARGRVEVSPEDMRTSARIYLALRALATAHGYHALAVSDWPGFQSELAIHPGLAFSWLDEHDGIPVASEGDVLGAATMLLSNEVSGGPSMLLDMNDLDAEREAVLMWHCGGSPVSFADEDGVSWKNHSTLGRKDPDARAMGAVADLRFRPQQATVLRLAADGSQLLALDARIIDSPHAGYHGSRGWVAEFADGDKQLSLADLVNTVVVDPFDHHFILGSGHHGGALREFGAWAGVTMIAPVPYQDHLQLGSAPESR